MVAMSRVTDRITPGVDLLIDISYTPPLGENRVDLTITAFLAFERYREVPADVVTFDPATGRVTGIWQEETTRGLVRDAIGEARFVRKLAGVTRLFYIRPVRVS